ncbi:MAG: thiol-disulfide oxidoreductase DCC family protein [Solirubrobacterales bacterium]
MAQATVLYDSDCGFCRWSLAKLLRWDRRHLLRPLALQDPEAGTLLPGMSEEERLASWHLVDAEGEVRSAGAALPVLLRLLPGGTPFALVAARAPRITERGYRWIAEHRSRFGRLLSERAKQRADLRIAARA